MFLRKSPWVVLSAFCLAACAKEDGAPGVDTAQEPEIRALTANLIKADSCDDLLSEIKADAVARVDQLADVLRKGGTRSVSGVDEDGKSISIGRGTNSTATTGAPAANPVPAEFDAPVDADSVGQAADDEGESAGGGNGGVEMRADPSEATEEVAPDGYSDTNRQVAEVDEADLVKVDKDGRNIYFLHGDRLVVLKSWPVDEAAIEHEVRLDERLGGQPYEMFAKDGRVVVFSAVSDSTPLREPSQDGDRAPSPEDSWCYDCGYSDRSFTKVTLIDATEDAPKVTRELYFDGTYMSSRRYDHRVRAVIRGGFKAPSLYQPTVEYQDPWGKTYAQEEIDAQVDAWRTRIVASIMATDLDDWLPQAVERDGDALNAIERDCGSYYIPAPGLVSYGMTSVIEFDMMEDDGAIGGTMVLGSASEVYSNTTTMVVAHRDYRRAFLGESGERTVLHRFALGAEGGADYEASGFVSGHLLNQFSMDTKDDLVRVTTSDEYWDEEEQERVTDNRLRILRVEGDELAVVGETPNLGKPRELIRSTRFVDDLAYVVTYERIDPLVVVSLKKPEDPKVLGQVEIPGFSTYMHPLDDGHLLTIGEFVDPQDGGNRALQLQIFDVTDPKEPKQQTSFVFPTGGNSLASQEHKAFNYYADKGLLAFPYVNYDWNSMRSTLEVFRVSVDDGFDHLGSIDHLALFENCQKYPDDVDPAVIDTWPSMGDAEFGGDVDPQWVEQQRREQLFYACPSQSVRRGVFIDEYVWSFSQGGVLVHAVDELALTSSEQDAVVQIDLTRPRFSDWSGNGGWNEGDNWGGIAVDPPRPRPATRGDFAADVGVSVDIDSVDDAGSAVDEADDEMTDEVSQDMPGESVEEDVGTSEDAEDAADPVEMAADAGTEMAP